MISKLIDMPKIVTITPATKGYTPTPAPTPVADKLPQESMLTAPDPAYMHQPHGPFTLATHG